MESSDECQPAFQKVVDNTAVMSRFMLHCMECFTEYELHLTEVFYYVNELRRSLESSD